jgi:hypothetical protein
MLYALAHNLACMFESFKRKNKSEIVGAVGLAAAAATGAGFDAENMITAGERGNEFREARAAQTQNVSAEELHKMQTPEGLPAVNINNADGSVTVNMAPQEQAPVSIDLHEETKNIDLSEKTVTMGAEMWKNPDFDQKTGQPLWHNPDAPEEPKNPTNDGF